MEHFDLIIIGSGSGNSIPTELADRWKIAVIERGVFGGTCLNVGCIPSKMFVLPADLAEQARHGPGLGVNTSFHDADWPAIRDRVFGRIDLISEGGKQYRRDGHPNITLIEGTARFVGDRRIKVGGVTHAADRVLIATGARAMIPPINGLAATRHHTSDTIMRLDRLPRRLGIIGGGFIAAELGHVFSAFGTEVTLFNRSNRLLRTHDRDVSQRFTEVFGKRVDLRLGRIPTEIHEVGDAIALTVHPDDDGVEFVEVDELLVATGRFPRSHDLDVHAAGIEVHPDGRIVTDDTMATCVEGVWAVGDVTNDHQLKHLANREAEIAFWNMTNPDQPRRIDRSVLPHAVFSDPQIGTVGMTEQEAEAHEIDYVVGRRDYGGTAFGWALEDDSSFAKVIIERATRKIIGAHVLGPQAASLIQLLVNAMTFGHTADEVAKAPFYVHPAATEVIENAVLDGLEQLERSGPVSLG
ncbi:MAG: mycothione reductase [Acidimicrobiia bacterium]|nr:mycothione reductase [Acidimicrobiia bacterium]